MSITTFSAFKNYNYRLYFTGQSMSLIGTWMQKTAVSWVVYTMTHSPFMLGVTAFATQVPMLLFSLLGGVVSDRYNRFKVLLLTQVLSMIQAIALAALVLWGHCEVWEILTLSVILGTINAFDVPARQPLVHEMITDKAELPNALALNSSMNNLARLVGPALSGIVLERFDAGVCFSLNALSFVAVLTSLLLMKLPPHVGSGVKKDVVRELSEGFTYVKNTREIGRVMLMLAFMSLLVLPYNTLIPVFAKVVFNGNAATFGYINSFIGLGAVIGAVFLASLKPGANLKLILFINTFLLGVSLILFSRIGFFPVAMAVAVVAGFGTMSQSTICNTIIQFHSDKKMRGRVISLLLVAIGLQPVGALAIGAVSERIGAQGAILCQGIVAVVVALSFARYLAGDRLGKEEKLQLAADESETIKKV